MNVLNWKQIEHFVPYLEQREEAVEDVCGVLILWAIMKEEGVREGGSCAGPGITCHAGRQAGWR